MEKCGRRRERGLKTQKTADVNYERPLKEQDNNTDHAC